MLLPVESEHKNRVDSSSEQCPQQPLLWHHHLHKTLSRATKAVTTRSSWAGALVHSQLALYSQRAVRVRVSPFSDGVFITPSYRELRPVVVYVPRATTSYLSQVEQRRTLPLSSSKHICERAISGVAGTACNVDDSSSVSGSSSPFTPFGGRGGLEDTLPSTLPYRCTQSLGYRVKCHPSSPLQLNSAPPF